MWKLTEQGHVNHAGLRGLSEGGSITLNGFYVFMVEGNGCFAIRDTIRDQPKEAQIKLSRELAEKVVKVLNRELPGGKPRVRRRTR